MYIYVLKIVFYCFNFYISSCNEINDLVKDVYLIKI